MLLSAGHCGSFLQRCYFNLSNHVGTDDVTSIVKAFTLVPLYSPRAVSFIIKKLAASEVSRKTS